MFFIRSGAGAPPLVLVHGFACAHQDWVAQVAHFSAHHDVVACDLRGHGQTPGRPHECTIAHFAGDVAALAANLELPGAVLVGHSMGCRVVVEAARLDPERLAGLVLIDGSFMGTGDPAQAEAAMRQALATTGYAAFAEALFRRMFLAESPVSRAIVARARALPAEVGANLFPNMVRWDIEQMPTALAAVRVPLLVIQSTYVNAERQRASMKAGQSTPWLDLVRSKVPGARIEIIPDAGHFPQIENAAEVNRLIEGFLGGLEPR